MAIPIFCRPLPSAPQTCSSFVTRPLLTGLHIIRLVGSRLGRALLSNISILLRLSRNPKKVFLRAPDFFKRRRSACKRSSMTLYSKLVRWRRSRLTTNHMQAYLLVICPASQSLTTTIYDYCIVPLVAAVVTCQWLQRWSTARHLTARPPAGLPARRPAACPPACRLPARRVAACLLVCRQLLASRLFARRRVVYPPTGCLPAGWLPVC
jgi:hypothetical protein